MNGHFADSLLPKQKTCFRRVRFRRNWCNLNGYCAKAGATGYVIGHDLYFGRVSVLFDFGSADLVRSNDVSQCALHGVDETVLEKIFGLF